MSVGDQEPIVAPLQPASEPPDPFTKIPFNPRKGLDMFAPIRPGVLKEIGQVDAGGEVTGSAVH